MDEDDEETKVLKRKAESDPLIPGDTSVTMCKVTGVEGLRECLRATEEKPITELNVNSEKPVAKKALFDPNIEVAFVLFTPPESIKEQGLTIDGKNELIHVVLIIGKGKWLGDRLNLVSLGLNKSGKSEIEDCLTRFVNEEEIKVLLITYQRFSKWIETLRKVGIGLIICDEGHYLMQNQSRYYKNSLFLNCKRRIIVSSTLTRNEMRDLYNLLDLVNSGGFGIPREFLRKYKRFGSNDGQLVSGEEQQILDNIRVRELWNRVSPYIIRRTSEIEMSARKLPDVYEFLIFCRLTELQIKLYKQVIPPGIERNFYGKNDSVLLKLGKICNHPQLVYNYAVNKEFRLKEDSFPSDFSGKKNDSRWSSKFCILEKLLECIRAEGNDKIVLTSRCSGTLFLLEEFCKSKNYDFSRLNTNMHGQNRNTKFDRFRDPNSSTFILILSLKTEGYISDLTCANRLIFFYSEWTPVYTDKLTDKIWKYGQDKPCFFYRFYATNTFEEKLLQKEMFKKGLESYVVDKQISSGRHFNFEKKRNLYLN
uniref:Helicase ATP-binding domain-containing protein n=1 Tax=Strongyloides papillosus TaxID=174720 RepID=A0A0N5C5V1_STREA